jgi:phage shock protein PspC (stress-responsive transcriptional regulator)
MSQPEMSQKMYRSERYAVLGGVCSGVALSKNYSIVLVRMMALALLTISGIGAIVYLLFWVFCLRRLMWVLLSP